MQVRALKDYCNNYDLTSLNIKAGDIITVRRSNNRQNISLPVLSVLHVVISQ